MPKVTHIIDDDAQVLAATSFLLVGQGYAIQVYADGKRVPGCREAAGGVHSFGYKARRGSGLDEITDAVVLALARAREAFILERSASRL